MSKKIPMETSELEQCFSALPSGTAPFQHSSSILDLIVVKCPKVSRWLTQVSSCCTYRRYNLHRNHWPTEHALQQLHMSLRPPWPIQSVSENGLKPPPALSCGVSGLMELRPAPLGWAGGDFVLQILDLANAQGWMQSNPHTSLEASGVLINRRQAR